MEFSAEIHELPNMLKWVREQLRKVPFSSSEKNKLEVAAEEILVNIINYAYDDGKGKIELESKIDENAITFYFKDFGKPFDPLKNEKPVLKSLSVDYKDIGGLGIFFVKKFIDKVSYQYEKGANILIISQNINKR